jgi:dienelactone hydrolase
MAIERQVHVYDGPGGPFEGVVVRDTAAAGPQPGVLLFPNILGQKDSDSARAEEVAALGYVVLVADVYGQGKRTTRESPDPGVYMNELNADRGLLRDRMAASLATLKALEGVDGARTAAIGFCFGGQCVLDSARAGLDLLGGVSFHGVYHRPDYANVSPITAKLLVCHGWEDPLATPEALVALGQELTEGKADWQVLAHGNAGHAFTDLSLKGAPPMPGFGYEERADRRSWQAAENFLAELFG